MHLIFSFLSRLSEYLGQLEPSHLQRAHAMVIRTILHIIMGVETTGSRFGFAGGSGMFLDHNLLCGVPAGDGMSWQNQC